MSNLKEVVCARIVISFLAGILIIGFKLLLTLSWTSPIWYLLITLELLELGACLDHSYIVTTHRKCLKPPNRFQDLAYHLGWNMSSSIWINQLFSNLSIPHSQILKTKRRTWKTSPPCKFCNLSFVKTMHFSSETSSNWNVTSQSITSPNFPREKYGHPAREPRWSSSCVSYLVLSPWRPGEFEKDGWRWIH